MIDLPFFSYSISLNLRQAILVCLTTQGIPFKKRHILILVCDEKSACATIRDRFGLKGYQIGKSKVFLRAGQMAELDARRIEVLTTAARRIQSQIQTYLMRKEFIILKRVTINVQKLWRGRVNYDESLEAIKMVLEKESWCMMPQETIQVVIFAGLVGDGASMIIQSATSSTSRELQPKNQQIW